MLVRGRAADIGRQNGWAAPFAGEEGTLGDRGAGVGESQEQRPADKLGGAWGSKNSGYRRQIDEDTSARKILMVTVLAFSKLPISGREDRS